MQKSDKKIKKLYKKQEKRLWEEWFKKKSPELETKLFEFYREWAEDTYGFFLSALRTGAIFKQYREEFLPVAYLAVIQAIRSYKKNGNASFKTYANKYIRNEISDAIYPFFHGNRQFKKIKFAGDIFVSASLDDPLYKHRAYTQNHDAKLIIQEVSRKLKKTIAEWGYTKKEWKVFYYQIFKFMSLKEIQEKTRLSMWKITITLAHIKKDILDEFGDEFKQLVRTKFD